MNDNSESKAEKEKPDKQKHEWLKERLAARGKTQVELATALQLPKVRITEIIKGTRAVQTHEIPVIAKMTGLPINEVVRNFAGQDLEATPELDNIGVFVRGQVQAGEWKTAEEVSETEWEVITVPKTMEHQRSYGLRVCGDSMNKVYPQGTIVICVPYMDYTKRIYDGDYVIVERTNPEGLSEATVKELKISEDGRIWLFPKSTNPEHQAPIELEAPANHDEFYGTKSARITGIVVGSVQLESYDGISESKRKSLPL